MDEKTNYPLWKVISQVILWLGVALVILVVVPILLIVLWFSGTERMMERKLPQVRELAEAYLDQQYPGSDYEITDAYHHWYDATFNVQVQSASSADTYFTVRFEDDTLEFLSDSYEMDVLQGGNVYDRVTEEYDAAVRAVLGEYFPELKADFCGSQFTPETGTKPEAKLDVDWEPDKVYDVSALGAQAGVVTLKFDNTQGTWPEAKREEALLRAARLLREAGVGFFAFDVYVAEETFALRNGEKYPSYDYIQRVLAEELK